jgi:hypothetical protein
MPGARREGQRGEARIYTGAPLNLYGHSRVWSLRNQESSEGEEGDIPTSRRDVMRHVGDPQHGRGVFGDTGV